MRENLNAWVSHVARRAPLLTELVELMNALPNVLVIREKSREVGCLPYVLTRLDSFNTITIRFLLLDHNSDSDVVITNMTTNPPGSRSKGLGSTTLQFLIAWAHEVGFKTVRATQVGSLSAERFWEKNGFTKLPRPNPCNDFIKEI